MENAQHGSMSNSTLLKSGTIVNEGKQVVADILIKNGRIEKIASSIDSTAVPNPSFPWRSSK